ncbi:MAG: hypothetical protein L6U99_09700 [Clostridium sp.]|nr:MAG: hypothetical protein L6U99_09700 [Clostridium sp.]
MELVIVYNNSNYYELISIDGKIVTTTNGHISTYEGNKLIWQGNHLIKYNDNTYSYDSNGLRRSKNNIKYYYENNNLVKRNRENELSYLYVNSAPYGLIYNDKLYYYIKKHKRRNHQNNR